MNVDELNLSHLREYARFLYENYLDEFVRAEIATSEKNELPLLKFFMDKSYEERFAITKKYVVEFLLDFMQGKALEGIITSMRLWKEDKFEMPRAGVSPLDMALLEKGRKEVLLKFLTNYTNDIVTALEIVQEIEKFYSFQSIKGIETFAEIQNELLLEKNKELTITYDQLKESNEELRRTEELLKENNEELEEIVLERTAEIKESEEKYKNFIGQSSEGIWRLEFKEIDGISVDLSVEEQIEHIYKYGYFAECNAQMAKIHGYTDPSEVLEKKVEEIMPFDIFSLKNYFPSFIKSNYYISEVESFDMDQDGNIIYILNNMQGVVENEKLIRAWGIQRDITEKKYAEEKLRSVVSNAPIILWSLNKEGNVTLAEGKDLYRNGEKEEGKESVEEMKYLRELSAEGRTALEGDSFAKIVSIEGKSFEVHYSPMVDLNGDVTGAVGVATDITDRVAIEKQLLESEDRLRQAVESANLGTWDISDINGEFVWDERSKGFFGLNKNATINFDVFLNGIHPEDREFVKSEVERTLSRERDDFNVEFRTVGYEDKKIRWLRVTGKAYFKRNKDLYRFVGTSQDITISKQYENNLKELADKLSQSQNRLSLITNAVPAFISYIEPDGTYTFLNDFYYTSLNVKGNVAGKKISDLVGEENIDLFNSKFELVLSKKDKVTFDYVLQEGNAKKNIRVNYIPDLDDYGNVRGVITMGIDLTDRISYEKILERKNAELSRINSDLDNFIYTASHDLKAPMTNIEGLITSVSEILQEENCELTPNAKEVFELIKASVKRFQLTINDLAEIGKIQKSFEYEDVDLINVKEIIEETELSIENKIEEAKAVINLDTGQCPEISFSRTNFRSIIYNLLTNSLKYRSPQRTPQIEVSCRSTNNYTIMEFKDNGLGMKEHLKDKVFQMFKRLHDHVEGTGVGLYLVKRIIDNSGGRIEVDTKENIGTVFRIFFRKMPLTFTE